jgi:hypothetical protein
MGTSIPQQKARDNKRSQVTQANIIHASEFVKHLRTGKNLSQSYRATFEDKADTWTSIATAASLYAKTDAVIQRLEELRGYTFKSTVVSIDSLTDELEEARFIAKIIENPSAMTQATLGKAKLHGFAGDKLEIDAGSKLLDMIMGNVPDSTGLPDKEAIEAEFERIGQNEP